MIFELPSEVSEGSFLYMKFVPGKDVVYVSQ